MSQRKTSADLFEKSPMTPDILLTRKLMARQDLTRAESAGLLEGLLRNDSEGWKLLAYSVASQTKGETVEELQIGRAHV